MKQDDCDKRIKKLKKENAKLKAQLEEWCDAFNGRTPTEARNAFDSLYEQLMNCNNDKLKMNIEMLELVDKALFKTLW